MEEEQNEDALRAQSTNYSIISINKTGDVVCCCRNDGNSTSNNNDFEDENKYTNFLENKECDAVYQNISSFNSTDRNSTNNMDSEIRERTNFSNLNNTNDNNKNNNTTNNTKDNKNNTITRVENNIENNTNNSHSNNNNNNSINIMKDAVLSKFMNLPFLKNLRENEQINSIFSSSLSSSNLSSFVSSVFSSSSKNFYRTSNENQNNNNNSFSAIHSHSHHSNLNDIIVNDNNNNNTYSTNINITHDAIRYTENDNYSSIYDSVTIDNYILLNNFYASLSSSTVNTTPVSLFSMPYLNTSFFSSSSFSSSSSFPSYPSSSCCSSFSAFIPACGIYSEILLDHEVSDDAIYLNKIVCIDLNYHILKYVDIESVLFDFPSTDSALSCQVASSCFLEPNNNEHHECEKKKEVFERYASVIDILSLCNTIRRIAAGNPSAIVILCSNRNHFLIEKTKKPNHSILEAHYKNTFHSMPSSFPSTHLRNKNCSEANSSSLVVHSSISCVSSSSSKIGFEDEITLWEKNEEENGEKEIMKGKEHIKIAEEFHKNIISFDNLGILEQDETKSNFVKSKNSAKGKDDNTNFISSFNESECCSNSAVRNSENNNEKDEEDEYVYEYFTENSFIQYMINNNLIFDKLSLLRIPLLLCHNKDIFENTNTNHSNFGYISPIQLHPADHICREIVSSPFIKYMHHHGIYAGNGLVIHFSGNENEENKLDFLTNRKSVKIKCDHLANFMKYGNSLVKVEYENEANNKADSPDVVLHRSYDAYVNQSFDSYNLLFNNCEHFCQWCKTGKSISKQANSVRTVVVAAATITAATFMLVKSFKNLRTNRSG